MNGHDWNAPLDDALTRFHYYVSPQISYLFLLCMTPLNDHFQTRWTQCRRRLPPLWWDIVPDIMETTRVLQQAQAVITNFRLQLTEEIDNES